MTVDDQPKRAPPKTPSGIVSSNIRQPSPAIRGAAQALLRAPSNPQAFSNTYNANNGALAAATSADSAGRRRPSGLAQLDAQNIEGRQRRPAYKKSLSFQGSQEILNGHNDLLRHSGEPSPSQMAAQLATARATPPLIDFNSNFQQTLRRPSPRPRPASADKLPEDVTTAPTKSLVQLYDSTQEPHKSAPITQ